MSKVYLRMEKLEEYPPPDLPHSLVGISRYSIKELINLIRKSGCKCSYLKLFNSKDILTLREDGSNYWYDGGFISKYVFHLSDSFEIWKPSKQAPLLIDHLEQDLRVLIAPQTQEQNKK